MSWLDKIKFPQVPNPFKPKKAPEPPKPQPAPQQSSESTNKTTQGNIKPVSSGYTLGPLGEMVIKYYESLELEAYPDPGSELGKACTAKRLPMREYRKVPNWMAMKAAPWTIGFGHTGGDVYPGLVITAQRAEELFRADVAQFEKDVTSLVKVPISQTQFDALVSFAYNCGSDIDADDIPEGLGDSTLLKRLNEKQYAAAGAQFEVWTKSGGVKLPGLVKRRAAERAMFEKASITREEVLAILKG